MVGAVSGFEHFHHNAVGLRYVGITQDVRMGIGPGLVEIWQDFRSFVVHQLQFLCNSTHIWSWIRIKIEKFEVNLNWLLEYDFEVASYFEMLPILNGC